MKLKKEYIGKKVYHNGIQYDLSNMNSEKLQRVYDNNINLRFMFEEEDITPLDINDILEDETNFNNTIEEYVKEVSKEPLKPLKKKK